MAGIKGMPGTKPTEVDSPVPEASQRSMLDSYAMPEAKAAGQSASALDQYASSGEASPQAVEQGYQGPGSSLLALSAEVAPTVGGIVGGIAGSGASIPGMAAMGMVGAAAGSAYKEFIMQSVLKRQPPQSIMQNIEGMKSEAATAGAGTLAGLGVTKGAMALAGTKLGTATLDGIANVAAKPLGVLKATVDGAREEIFQPLQKILASKITPLTSEESGNAIKAGIGADIKQKFSGFIDTYSNLDKVARALPVEPEQVAKGFTNGIRNWAVDLPQGSYKTVKAFADRLDQSMNGEGLYKVLGDLKTDAVQATKDAVKYNSNALRDHAAALNQMADKTENYIEDSVIGGIAKRISTGKASMEEMQGFERMMVAQQNPTVKAAPKNFNAYMKSVANDYLDQRATVKTEYSKFRGLLEDVGESAKVNASTSGPMQFLNKLNDIPPDVLVERMFQPKNAGALRAMQKTYPQVYDNVIKNKMSDIVSKFSTVDGNINYKGIAQAIDNLPEGTGNLLMTAKERATMLEAVNNPRLELLAKEHAGIADKFVTGLARIGEIMRTGTKAAIQNNVTSTGAVPAITTGAVAQVGRALSPMQPPQQPQ